MTKLDFPCVVFLLDASAENLGDTYVFVSKGMKDNAKTIYLNDNKLRDRFTATITSFVDPPSSASGPADNEPSFPDVDAPE